MQKPSKDDAFHPRARPTPVVRAVARLGISIRVKLLIAFLGMTGLMTVIAFLGLATLRQSNARTEALIESQQRIEIYDRIYLSTNDALGFGVSSAVANPVRSSAPAGQLINEMNDLFRIIARAVHTLGGAQSVEGARVAEFHAQISSLRLVAFEILQARKAGEFDRVRTLMNTQVLPVFQKIQRSAYTRSTEISEEMKNQATETRLAYERARRIVLIASVSAVLLSLFAGYVISSTIIWPVERIGRTLSSVASGNFDARVQVPNQDEFGTLAEDANTMSDKLGKLYDKVHAQRDQLANWNRDLEHRVARQVEEISRSNRLRRFLPKQVTELILSAEDGADLLSSRRGLVTVLFADLRGFTAYANAVDPERVIAALNAFHATVGPLIEHSGGTLERFLGDGLMVLFNAPAPCEEPGEKALALACEMQAAFHPALRPFQSDAGRLGLGIGIATGQATLGQIGFEGRLDYAAIGTAPNLAARLCNQARDGQILMCEITAQGVTPSLNRVGPFDLKGMTDPVMAYEPERRAESL